METYQLKHKGEEIDAILDKAKAADPLEDLAEIREGASKGATAVQPEEIEPLAPKDYVGEELAAGIAPLATKVELSDAVQGLKTYIDEKDIENFNLAKSYTDDAIAAAIATTLNEEV